MKIASNSAKVESPAPPPKKVPTKASAPKAEPKAAPPKQNAVQAATKAKDIVAAQLQKVQSADFVA